jgi:hypothetical protein
MESSKIDFDNMQYVNLGYILSQIGDYYISPKDGGCTLLGDAANRLKSNMENLVANSSIELLVVDMDGIKPIWEKQNEKPSWMQPVFESIVKKESIKSLLFANCDEATANLLREKDFFDSNKVLVLSFDYESEYLKSCNNANNDEALRKVKEIVFNDNTEDDIIVFYKDFIQKLIGKRIKRILSDNECIKDISVFSQHILHSTPVHVNKYVNLKPILEKHDYFQEVCYLLHRHIYNSFHAYPDYVVASSRNSMYIASGLLKFFQTVDMIIIDQVSPVTKLSNFSNLDDIKPKRKYAIIEDFCCMGTEIKTVKSVLWSRGVDVDQYCYTFPIVSTNLFGNKTKDEFGLHKIYPLHILDESENYLMFTNNCCPICNELNCKHKDAFKI